MSEEPSSWKTQEMVLSFPLVTLAFLSQPIPDWEVA